MQYKHFIGIDIAKYTFDVFLRGKALHKQLKNDESGFGFLIAWLAKHIGESSKIA